MTAQFRNRRLFVGDLHGCLSELDDLLGLFGFRKGLDTLYSVGDVVGKGPDVTGTLRRLQDSEAKVVFGNHDQTLLRAAQIPEAKRSAKDCQYLQSLGTESSIWIPYIASWPAFLELEDIILVHAGLEPGKEKVQDMSERVLVKIRTWDGIGDELHRPDDPPWYTCVAPKKTIVFGHWAQRGLIDLPHFKGLDTGCVYGGQLTGWCPEEHRFLHVQARHAYSPIHYH
jgi:bis(5'-nucleosyl)-tetraphosphatase (symmetrical)